MTILATVIVLGVLIFVHELGHFFAAKAVGIEVQRFSIGLGPRVWGFQMGETDYVLSAIPLGGYVKMGGMADEVMEKVEGGQVERVRMPGPRDFDAKPIWARTLVISAGVIMNFFFAFASYSATMMIWGVRETAETRIGVVYDAQLPTGAEGLGSLRPGDRVVEIADRPVAHWGSIRDAILDGPAGPTRVVTTSPAQTLEFRLPSSEEDRLQVFLALRHWIEPIVGLVPPGSRADEAGLMAGDRVLVVDGEAVTTWWDFRRVVEVRPEMPTLLQVLREGQPVSIVVTPEAVDEVDPATGEPVTRGRVGINPPPDEAVHEPIAATQAVIYGYRETVAITGLIFGFLRDLVTGNISPRSVGSIVTIGEASGQAAQMGLETFIRFMALFSVNLAVLNLLPIPILDGGHLVFLAIEAVRGRALSIEQRLRWSNVGLLIVMGLMVWALSNDVLRLLGI